MNASVEVVSKYAAIEQRVKLQQAALLHVMKSDLLAQNLTRVFAQLTEICATTIGARRVSIWRFTDDRATLELIDLYELDTNRHSSGARLNASHYPIYFEALRWNRAVNACDARTDTRTAELTQNYLLPLDVYSLLDATIWYGGESQGVVCVEAVGTKRDWTPDEQQFSVSIADLTAMAFENNHRRETEDQLSASENRFSRVFWLSPDWIVVKRVSDGMIIEVNESFERQSGYMAQEIVGHTVDEIGLWAFSEQRDTWHKRITEGGSVRGFEAALKLKSGEIRTFEIATERLEIDGEMSLISIGRDITASKRQERLVFDIAQSVAAASGEDFFRSLVECLARALDADMAFVGELDHDDESCVNTIAVQKQSGASDNFIYRLAGSPCETVLGRGICAYPRNVAQLFPDDIALTKTLTEGYVGAPLMSSSGKPLGLIAVLFKRPLEQSGVAIHMLQIFAARAAAELERRDQLAELEYRATHDLLTGLQNRSALERDINRSIDAAKHGYSALLLIDLDHFKEINDTLGHAAGDLLLAKLAHRLMPDNEGLSVGDDIVAQEVARGIAPGGAREVPGNASRTVTRTVARSVVRKVARLGGDEFAIWLENLADPQLAKAMATQTLATITAPFDIQGYRLQINASIGIALHPGNGASAIEIMRCADVAMYIAKRRGNSYAVYDRADDTHSRARLVLIGEIGDAVTNRQLELHYQPKISLQTNQPTGFEALVRWRHPTRGLLPPSQFIPLAELSDIILPLTLWVLDQSLAQLKSWTNDAAIIGTTHQNFRVAVNLSARHLMDEAFPEQVRQLLEKHQVPASQLELEITESALIADPERATRVLRHVQDIGIKIAIDDFGTGYSSLSHLKTLPVSTLKIDISFVLQMLSNEKDAAIVESTINLAHNLGLSVVAEGIEDETTLTALRDLGCNEGQGFFISRPMTSAHATAWLKAALV